MWVLALTKRIGTGFVGSVCEISIKSSLMMVKGWTEYSLANFGSCGGVGRGSLKSRVAR